MTARTFKTVATHESIAVAPATGPFLGVSDVPTRVHKLGNSWQNPTPIAAMVSTPATWQDINNTEAAVDLGSERTVTPSMAWELLADGFGLISFSFEASADLVLWGWSGCLGEEINLSETPSSPGQTFRTFTSSARYLRATWWLRSGRPYVVSDNVVVEAAGRKFDFGAPVVAVGGANTRKAKARFGLTAVTLP